MRYIVYGLKNNSTVMLVQMSDQESYTFNNFLDNSKKVVIKRDFVVKHYYFFSNAMSNEIYIMNYSKRLPHIKRCIGVEVNIIGYSIFMENEDNNLADLIPEIRFNPKDILLQIATGLRSLHRRNIIHLDLKSDNIMETNGIFKIIDFATVQKAPADLSRRLSCTITHRPPFGCYDIDCSFDIWGFGMIALEIYTNQLIHRNESFPEYEGVELNEYTKQFTKFILSDEFKIYYQKNLPEHLWSCLDVNPMKRPNIDEVIQSLSKN